MAWLSRLARATIMALLLTASVSSAASAHASLVRSDPADQALIRQRPDVITLTFNEPVDPISVRILDADGAATNVADIVRDQATLVLKPPSQALGEGAHVLSWRVISADGHPVGGALTFWIGRKGTSAPIVHDAEGWAVRAGIWLTRVITYIGFLVGAGGAFALAWFGIASRSARIVSLAASFAALAALTVSVGFQGLDAIGAPIPSLGRIAVWVTGAQGSFGRATAIGAAALILGLLSLRSRVGLGRVLSLLALCGVGGALAASGHASDAPPRALMTAAVFLHGVSLAFWIGALIPLLETLRQSGKTGTAILMRFSRVIPVPVALLVISGVLLAIVQLAHIDALWTTAYGRVLSVKIALLIVLFALALWNRLTLTPRIQSGAVEARCAMRRSIAAELAIVLMIFGVVGLWRFTPPPRSLAAADDSFFTHIHTGKAMANITVAPGRAGPVTITVQLETPDETPLDAKALSLSLSKPDAGIEPATAEAKPAGRGLWRAAMSAPIKGQWTLDLRILISDFDEVRVEAPILIE
jgi:copper transport protein